MTMTPPPWPTTAPAESPRRSTAVLAAIAVLLSVAALIVAIISLTRSTNTSTPHYTASQQAAAKKNLCDQYKLAAYAEHIETNTPNNYALARLSATNGALILETAAADPALDAKYRDAARALALKYQNFVAIATGKEGDDPELEAVINEANANDRVMIELCGN